MFWMVILNCNEECSSNFASTKDLCSKHYVCRSTISSFTTFQLFDFCKKPPNQVAYITAWLTHHLDSMSNFYT